MVIIDKMDSKLNIEMASASKNPPSLISSSPATITSTLLSSASKIPSPPQSTVTMTPLESGSENNIIPKQRIISIEKSSQDTTSNEKISFLNKNKIKSEDEDLEDSEDEDSDDEDDSADQRKISIKNLTKLPSSTNITTKTTTMLESLKDIIKKEEQLENKIDLDKSVDKKLDIDNKTNIKSELLTSKSDEEQKHQQQQDTAAIRNILQKDTKTKTESVQSSVVRPSYANGSLPTSGGKPLMATMNKKLTKPRGRPKRKALVAMYHSQISDNKLGIKLCIKKSDTTITSSQQRQQQRASRKRSRKTKQKKGGSDSDDSDYEKRRRRETIKQKANNNTDKQKKLSTDGSNIDVDFVEPIEQSAWGNSIPENVLYKIFQNAIHDEGCLPTLVKLSKVCSLWRQVSFSNSLWHTLDFSAWVKERYRTEIKLKWLIDNRMRGCSDVNLSNWKVTNIQCVLEKLAIAAPELNGITLSGWKGLTSDHLMFLVEELKKLQRIDLSSINVEANASKSAVGLTSLCNAIQGLNGRLTHLYLAHNRLAGMPQIITSLAAYSPNLILLDLSNICTLAISHAVLHIEKLQQGCKKLKVLRITNAQITLSPTTLQEQMDSPGFPDLEELSVASLAESRIINDEFLQRILKTSTKLKLLDIRGCARLTHDSLIRLPTWDLKHLFLSGCSVTRDIGSGLELIASKWAHSLTEFDLAWANVQEPLDNALKALAEKQSESPLTHLNLCGSSVSLEAVKEILTNCPLLKSINLSSCRGLPRGVKRLLQGPTEISELRENLGVTFKVPSATTSSSSNN